MFRGVVAIYGALIIRDFTKNISEWTVIAYYSLKLKGLSQIIAQNATFDRYFWYF